MESELVKLLLIKLLPLVRHIHVVFMLGSDLGPKNLIVVPDVSAVSQKSL